MSVSFGLNMEPEPEPDPEAATNLAAARVWLRDRARVWYLRDGYNVTRGNADVMPSFLRRALSSTSGPRLPLPLPVSQQNAASEALLGELEWTNIRRDAADSKVGSVSSWRGAMAEYMLIKRGRSTASRGVLTITDGKPSLNLMTNEMVEQLDDKNVMCYFAVINDDGPASDGMMQIRK